MLAFNPGLDPSPSYVQHFFFFSSRPSRKSDWPTTLEAWPICFMQMQSNSWRLLYWDPQAAHLIDLLSTGLKYTASTSQLQVVHPLHAFTTTPMSPLLSRIPNVGVTDAPAATAMSSSIEGTTSSSHKGKETPLKCHQISPTLTPQPDITLRPISPSCPSPSDTSTSFPL